VHTLLDAVDPIPDSQAKMLRIRRELDQKRGPRAARVPALGLAALVVLFGASAFAAVRIYVAVVAPPTSTTESLTARSPAHSAARPAHHRPQTSIAPTLLAPAPAQDALVADEPPSSMPAPGKAAAVVAPLRSANPQARTGTRSASNRGEPHARAHAEPTSSQAIATASDSELVHRALKALRRDHDPALAARLLEQHRARSPAGPLAEEALSLQIEAASLLGDPRAHLLAREYLARYPNGRYLSVAQRALQDPAL
jgi:hypothetical protein